MKGLVILVGDCRETLRTLEPESVDCVVTSPPYFQLRDYGVAGQIGREETLTGYIDALVSAFAEVRRVLKPTGTVWLNLGDCYADKQLMLVPARVVLALQEAGWWLRSEIVWGKRGGGMPESVKTRPSSSHEKIWLLTKQGQGYFYAHEASALPAADTLDMAIQKVSSGSKARGVSGRINGAGRNDPDIYARERNRLRRARHRRDTKSIHIPGQAIHSFHQPGHHENDFGPTRRLRNYEAPVEVDVWEMGTAGFPGAHFAVFPAELVERALTAGCPPGGRVLDPFGGSGTTALVALRTGRSAVLCELSDEYAALARERVESGGKLDSDLRRQARSTVRRAEQEAAGQGALL